MLHIPSVASVITYVAPTAVDVPVTVYDGKPIKVWGFSITNIAKFFLVPAEYIATIQTNESSPQTLFKIYVTAGAEDFFSFDIPFIADRGLQVMTTGPDPIFFPGEPILSFTFYHAKEGT